MPELLRDHEWRGGDGPRVLVEATEWPSRQAIEQVLRDAGYRTAACAGPEGSGQRCTLAAEVWCPAAEQADVVVHSLRTTDARNVEALRALRRHHPSTPVVVQAPLAIAAKRALDFVGCVLIDSPSDPTALLAAVDRALATRP